MARLQRRVLTNAYAGDQARCLRHSYFRRCLRQRLEQRPRPLCSHRATVSAHTIAVNGHVETKTMSSSTSRRMKIGDFLLRRLEEAGVRHLFGVPGDYNLELLQQLRDTGRLRWIGTCSELNASYAADGYARLKALGALLVTNGVGALSAINGVAGSYSEHVPVICIAGSIPLRSIERGLGMHHTMADGSYDHFLNAYAHVTAAQ